MEYLECSALIEDLFNDTLNIILISNNIGLISTKIINECNSQEFPCKHYAREISSSINDLMVNISSIIYTADRIGELYIDDAQAISNSILRICQSLMTLTTELETLYSSLINICRCKVDPCCYLLGKDFYDVYSSLHMLSINLNIQMMNLIEGC